MCGEEIDCGMLGHGEGHHGGNKGGEIEEYSGEQCHYDTYFMIHDDHGNEHVDIAAENGWDMIGFLSDYTHYDPQDGRIDDEFIVHMYDIVCCEDLRESIEARMRLHDFSIEDLDEHNNNEYSENVL